MTLSGDLDGLVDDAVALEQQNTLLVEGNASKAALIVQKDAALAAQQVTIGQLTADLAACNEDPPPDPPPPPPPLTGTLWGMGSLRLTSTNTAPELDIYRNKTPLQVFQAVNSELASLVPGAKMNVIRVYDGGFPNSWSAHDASWVPSDCAVVASFKGSDGTMVSGGYDATIRSFVQSVPASRKVYLLWNHERDNDADALANPTTVMAAYNRAVAHFAKVVLAERGAKDITPGCCPTGWNLQDQNSSYPRDVLNCKAALQAEGVTLDKFIYMVDSYQRGTAEPAGFSRVTSPIFRRLKGWGFTRLGLGELAVDSYGSATRALADDYIRNADSEVASLGVEVVCWYESGGGNKAGAQGWWIFGTEPKRAWAQAVAGK